MPEDLSVPQREGRLKNATAEFLQRRLMVPKIFLDAKWPNYGHVDVLAVDRAGAGDINIADVKTSWANLYDAVSDLMRTPAHYKYITTFENNALQQIDESRLYAPDGVGRIGIIVISEHPEDKSLHGRLFLAPERFRLESKYWKDVDAFLASSPADLEIRDI